MKEIKEQRLREWLPQTEPFVLAGAETTRSRRGTLAASPRPWRLSSPATPCPCATEPQEDQLPSGRGSGPGGRRIFMRTFIRVAAVATLLLPLRPGIRATQSAAGSTDPAVDTATRQR